jgi:hypothetical protein
LINVTALSPCAAEAALAVLSLEMRDGQWVVVLCMIRLLVGLAISPAKPVKETEKLAAFRPTTQSAYGRMNFEKSSPTATPEV